MRVLLYPADEWACGKLRMTWPADLLAARGHDVTSIEPANRRMDMVLDRSTNPPTVTDVLLPEGGADVYVFQRATHLYVMQAIPLIRAKGCAVVVDIDDDLSNIDPANPAHGRLNPANIRRGLRQADGNLYLHSWEHLTQACRDATLVTVSTPGLLKRYARHGRGRVVRNYLPDHYYGLPRRDNAAIGWPAALAAHPHDPDVLGPAMLRLVQEGYTFTGYASDGLGKAFRLPADPPGSRDGVEVMDWPRSISEIGVGIAPLSDTVFNASKSWLKPLELCATGVPWVASPRVEYKRLQALGAGVLADNPRTWYSALKRLATSESERDEQSQAGRAVAETLRLRDHVEEWWAAWGDALAIERQSRVAV